MERMKSQALNLGARISADSVVDVDTTSLPFHVLTASNKVYAANSLIIATSCEYKTLNLKNEYNLIGRGISMCATRDSLFYTQKDVVVIGESRAAVMDALHLSKIVNQVVIICRRRSLSCGKALKSKLHKRTNINTMYNTKILSYAIQTAENKSMLSAVQLSYNHRKILLRTDGVFLAIGSKPQTDAFKTVKKNASGYIITKPKSARTNIRGIFAAGDIVSNSHKQAIAAANSGYRAALEVEKFLCL